MTYYVLCVQADFVKLSMQDFLQAKEGFEKKIYLSKDVNI